MTKRAKLLEKAYFIFVRNGLKSVECINQIKEPFTYEEASTLLFSVGSMKRFYLFLVLSRRVGFATRIDEIKTFVDAYTNSDNINRQCSDFNADHNERFGLHGFLAEMLRMADRRHFMDDSEFEFYQALPEIVTIYRGCGEIEFESGYHGISWTLDNKIAEFYASYYRNNSPRGGVIRKDVPKKHIIAYLSCRDESEVLFIDGVDQ